MKLALLFFLAVLSLDAFSQETEYKAITNVPYYSESVRATDAYIKERCVLDIYYPLNVKKFATVVWFHGGGIKNGEKEIPNALKVKGYCVIGVNYRLYPKVKAPAFIEDAAAAVAWAFKNINTYGGDSSLIFVSGHSAGAYLSLMIGLDKKWLNANQIDANRIAGLIPLSGQAITHFVVREDKGMKNTQPLIDEYAPLYYVRADAPPMLLITGDRELELLGRYEENAYLMRMMKIVGHKQTRLLELQGYGHLMTEPAFPLLLEEVKRIVDEKNKARE